MKKIILTLTFLISLMIMKAQQEAKFLRFPNVKNDNVVFSYAGDLYTVQIHGGIARRLTSHIGDELFAKYSPDGKYIAFSGQYDGNTEVYIISAIGGEPKRLTYTATVDRDDVADRMGPNNIVMAWTPDSKKIIFRSRCVSFNDFRGQLYSVSVDGGMPEPLPFIDGGFCSFSPDAKFLAFNKIFREFRTWKYYKGGMADDIWIYDFKNQKASKIFENDAQDVFPMWVGDKIYFASDRDRTMNIFAYDTKTKQVDKITNFNDYDVKFPSCGDDKIVFEKGGELFYLDTKTNKTTKITVQINNDVLSSYNNFVDASKNITTIDFSPNNDFLLFSARGEIFRVPSVKGVTKNFSNSISSHERSAVWSPDGNYIAFISDRTGEYEVFIQKAHISEPPTQLTSNYNNYIYNLKWSPDSKKILFSDRLYRLRFIDISSKKITEVDKSDYFEIHQYNWSPDSRWITYSLPNSENYSKIVIFDTQNNNKITVSDGFYPAYSAVFSDDGKYLIFTSGRTFVPTYDDLDWNVVYNNLSKIYLVLLKKDTKNPIAPVESYFVEQDKPKENEDKTNEINNKHVVVEIDAQDIQNRIVELPIRASNYSNIYCIKDKVYYTENSENSENSNFYFFDLKTLEEKKIATDVNYYIPFSNKKMLIVKDRKYALIDIPVAEIDFSKIKYADLSQMQFYTNYKEEYKQIFYESWRQMRDFFYDPNMHGVDWNAIQKKYSVLLPYINHRKDLTYLIGEMIGELNVGHAYVGGGDVPKINKIYTGLLGALFSKDKSGYFKIYKILRGAPWDKTKMSPLAIAGLNVNEGDFIIAINGIETKTVDNIYKLLVNTAGKPTELLINTTPSIINAKKIIVEPLKSEADLYYFQWVTQNIEYVNKKTNGLVGYIHIPDMSWKGMSTFVEYFYPQINKKALIIDDRGNGGGNVSPIITEILRRQIAFTKMWRNTPMAGPVPNKTHVGPKIMLIDQYSASDGDLFPYQFKYYKIGKVVGKRTWGGVIGIRGSLPFIDGGYLNKPEYGHYSADGKQWIIEGHGVDPDIVVENNPADVFNGIDSQLDKAIEIIVEELKNFDQGLKNPPQFPNKSGK